MERMIGNCFFFKKDDNTKMKKNASFFGFFWGKNGGESFQVFRELEGYFITQILQVHLFALIHLTSFSRGI